MKTTGSDIQLHFGNEDLYGSQAHKEKAKKCQKLEATGAQKEEAAKLGEEREIGESVDFGREAPGAVCTGGGICVVVLWQCSFF